MNNEKNDVMYTQVEILKGITNLPEIERENLLQLLSISNVNILLNGDALKLKECCEIFTTYAEKYLLLVKTLKKLSEELKSNTVMQAEIVNDYNMLDTNSRKKVVLDLMNNYDFQKNCCEIMVKDYERLVKSNSTLSTIDSRIGLGKYFKELVDTGIGCNHKYEVE